MSVGMKLWPHPFDPEPNASIKVGEWITLALVAPVTVYCFVAPFVTAAQWALSFIW